jgi:DNA polymerase
MIVGEQPGDIEDLHGRPFVGPSGKLLRSILVELSVEDDAIYFTNAVKHFKYTVRGKRRLHQRPTVGDIDHCRPWLSAEISLIKPKVIITMGSTATRSLFGRTVPLEEHRGRLQSFDVSVSVMVTHHPAMMLRASNPDDRRRLNGQLVEDLRTALSDVMRNDEA